MAKLLFIAIAILALGSLSYSDEISQKINWLRFITITTWVGDLSISKEHTITLLVQENTSFYEVMKKAARANSKHFGFEEIRDEAHGRLITSIGGVKQNEENNHYWMIYVLKARPDHLHPPTDEQLSPIGVDEIRVQKGDHYLWWYKKVRKQ